MSGELLQLEAAIFADEALIANIDQAKRLGQRAYERDPSVCEWHKPSFEPIPLTKKPGDARLLDEVRAFISRFIAFPLPHYVDIVTLWALHTHAVQHFFTTPRLAVLSREPESAKTRLLEVLDVLVPSPMLVFSPSPATVFRKLVDEKITLLIDESDTIFTKKGKDDQHEDLRSLLNCGYRRGATIPRCVGPRHEVRNFDVFAPVALAGLGDLPATIMTRAITLRMRRRLPSERIEQFRLRWHEPEGHELRDRLGEWAVAHGVAVGSASPELPEGCVDRRAECWEPLISIADAVGGDWPRRARVAAVADVAQLRERAPTLGVALLIDLKQVFRDRHAVFTNEILKELNEMTESPWGEIAGGKPLNDRGLASRLRGYGIRPRDLRIGAEVRKGYHRVDLWDAWQRYTSSHPAESATSATEATVEQNGGASELQTTETSATNVPASETSGIDVCRRCDGEAANGAHDTRSNEL